MRRPRSPLTFAAARLTPLLALALTVAACGEIGDADEPADAPSTEPVMLGGVDLTRPVRALGTEPFWGVDITPEALVYSGVDRPEQRASNDGPVVQGTTAVFTGATPRGQALVVTLIATECSDGMSDRTYPLTARVEIGPEILNGCAASTSAIMSAGESGPVIDGPAAPESESPPA